MKRSFLFIFLLALGCHKEEKPEIPKVPVHVGKVIQKTVPLWLDTVGNVLENVKVTLTPQAAGKVVEIPVVEGQMVRKGDLLYKIDPRPYEAQLLQAQGTLEKDQATLEYQKISLERYSKLIQNDYVSKLQIDQLQTSVQSASGQVKQDEGALETAKINLEFCYVRSPINGKISQFNVNIGNVVAVNDPNFLTVIREIQPIQVQFSYPQRDFEEILRKWQAVHGEENASALLGDQKTARENLETAFPFECFLYNDNKRSFQGKVYFIDNAINTKTGAILFKGLYANEDLGLWPGAFVRVKMLVKQLEDAILVPLIAVEKGQKGFGVFVVKEDETVELRLIDLGPQIDDYYVVNSGLKAGETVVTLGQLNLRPGLQVDIQK